MNALFATLLGSLAVLCLFRRRSSVRAVRQGIDPGIFNLKLWPARIWFLTRGYATVQKAYLQNKHEKYLIQTLYADKLVLPHRFLPELRMLPTSKLNAEVALVETTMGRYNGVDIILKDRQANDIARVQLTKSLPLILSAIGKEVGYELADHLGSCTQDQYKAFNARGLIFALNLRATLLAFSGKELCRNCEWKKVISDFHDTPANVVIPLTFCPEFLRPLAKYLIPAHYQLKRIHERVRFFLFEHQKVTSDTTPTVLQHFLTTSRKASVDQQEIVSKFLILSSAALHTMTDATLQAIYDLCNMPHYIDSLRIELTQALSQSGGVWNLEATRSMQRMDSFLKESQRFNPPHFLAFDRVVLVPIDLSDGTKLLPGQFITMSALGLSRDPEFYPNPDKFDGMRFYRGNDEQSDIERAHHRFSGIEPHNIFWGHGRNTCPGRFYAAEVMKIFLGEILLKYDISLPQGQGTRPSNSYLDDSIVPDYKQDIMFRARAA